MCYYRYDDLIWYDYLILSRLKAFTLRSFTDQHNYKQVKHDHSLYIIFFDIILY